jgi:hypothetical protein
MYSKNSYSLKGIYRKKEFLENSVDKTVDIVEKSIKKISNSCLRAF